MNQKKEIYSIRKFKNGTGSKQIGTLLMATTVLTMASAQIKADETVTSLSTPASSVTATVPSTVVDTAPAVSNTEPVTAPVVTQPTTANPAVNDPYAQGENSVEFTATETSANTSSGEFTNTVKSPELATAVVTAENAGVVVTETSSQPATTYTSASENVASQVQDLNEKAKTQTEVDATEKANETKATENGVTVDSKEAVKTESTEKAKEIVAEDTKTVDNAVAEKKAKEAENVKNAETVNKQVTENSEAKTGVTVNQGKDTVIKAGQTVEESKKQAEAVIAENVAKINEGKVTNEQVEAISKAVDDYAKNAKNLTLTLAETKVVNTVEEAKEVQDKVEAVIDGMVKAVEKSQQAINSQKERINALLTYVADKKNFTVTKGNNVTLNGVDTGLTAETLANAETELVTALSNFQKLMSDHAVKTALAEQTYNTAMQVFNDKIASGQVEVAVKDYEAKLSEFTKAIEGGAFEAGSTALDLFKAQGGLIRGSEEEKKASADRATIISNNEKVAEANRLAREAYEKLLSQGYVTAEQAEKLKAQGYFEEGSVDHKKAVEALNAIVASNTSSEKAFDEAMAKYNDLLNQGYVTKEQAEKLKTQGQYEEGSQEAKDAQAKYEADKATFNAEKARVEAHNASEKARYDKEVAEAKVNSTKEGYLSEVVSQPLYLLAEPNAKVTVEGGNPAPVSDAFREWNSSQSGYATLLTKGLSQVANYNKLTESYYIDANGKKIKIASVKAIITSHLNNLEGFIYDNPWQTLYYWNGSKGGTPLTEPAHSSEKVTIDYTLYDENGNEIVPVGGLISVSSLNNFTTEGGGIEKAQVANAKFIYINGSDVVEHADGAYSDVDNSSYGANNSWDLVGSDKAYKGAGVYQLNGRLSITTSTDGRSSVWFATNTEVKAPTITPPSYEELTVTEPVVPVTYKVAEKPSVPSLTTPPKISTYKVATAPVEKPLEEVPVLNIKDVVARPVVRPVLTTYELPTGTYTYTNYVLENKGSYENVDIQPVVEVSTPVIDPTTKVKLHDVTLIATYHENVLNVLPKVQKSVYNGDGVEINNKLIAKNDTVKWVLSSQFVAGRQAMDNITLSDVLADGLEYDEALTSKENSNFIITTVKDESGKVVSFRATAKEGLEASINGILDKAYTMNFNLYTKAKNDGAVYPDTFQLTYDDIVTDKKTGEPVKNPDGSIKVEHNKVTSNTVRVHTTGKNTSRNPKNPNYNPNDPNVPENDLFEPTKHNHDIKGTIIDGKLMQNGDVNYYHVLQDFTNGVEDNSSILVQRKGFGGYDLVDKDVLTVLSDKVAYKVLDQSGKEVTNHGFDLSKFKFEYAETLDGLSAQAQKLLTNGEISLTKKQGIAIWYVVDDHAIEFYQKIVKKGYLLDTILPAQNDSDYVGLYHNQAGMIAFGNAYATNKVTNEIKPINIMKDIVLEVGGQSIKDTIVKVGEKVLYRLQSDLLEKGRAYDVYEDYFVDNMPDAMKYTGMYKVVSDVDFIINTYEDVVDDTMFEDDVELEDGTVVKAGEIVKAGSKRVVFKQSVKAGDDNFLSRFFSIKDEDGQIVAGLSSDFYARLSKDSNFQYSVYLQAEALKEGTHENTFYEVRNGKKTKEAKVTIRVEKPEMLVTPVKPVDPTKPVKTTPAAPAKVTPAVQTVASPVVKGASASPVATLPQTGQESGAGLTMLGLALGGLAVGLKKKKVK